MGANPSAGPELHAASDSKDALAVGLFLNSCHFDWHNERHEKFFKEPVTPGQYDALREKFKCGIVLPSVIRKSISEKYLVRIFQHVQAYRVKSIEDRKH